jgi:2-methylcitrate dehydratase PrpD
MAAQLSASGTLATFVAEASWDDLPDQARKQARRSLLNFVGCALGAAEEPAIEAIAQVLGQVSGPPQATLIGRSERFDMLAASTINAAAGNLFDFDDTHLATVIHPAAPVAPVTLALGERIGASGHDILLALALGIEVECRIGNAVSPAHYARGWHITATCGVFGAAAAAAKLLRLSPDVGAHALGIAASESAGLVENLTTAAKNVGVGNAARNGLFAALMAQAGYSAAPQAIEGSLGWARAAGDVPDMARMLDGLASAWELNANTFKPYPSGVVLHAVADACLALRSEHGFDSDEVESVTVAGDALLLARGDRLVANERDARVSIQHTVAVALLTGAAGLDQYTPRTVSDPAIAAFRGRVTPVLDASLPKGAARVEIRVVGNRTLKHTVLHARGSLAQPLTDEEIVAKVRDLARRSRIGDRIDAITKSVWSLETAHDVKMLCELVGVRANTG